MNFKKSFTLIELMIVIAILAILSAIVLFALNPIRLFDNFRDTRRVADINTINKAINFVETWNTNGISYGSTSIVYISLPDTSSTCSSYSLPTLPTGYTYSCKTQANYRKVDSTGWIPIDFSINQSNSYLNVLPIDPVNDTTYYYTYYPGGSYVLTTQLANANSISINDNGDSGLLFETGTPNYTSMPIIRETSLTGCWKFNEGTGTKTYDLSGRNNHGTLTNGPTWALLDSGRSVLELDGIDDWINCATGADMGGDSLTWNFWIKTSDDQGSAILSKAGIGKGDFDVPISGSDNAIFYFMPACYLYYLPRSQSANTVDGAWHFFTGVIDRKINKVFVYLDGVENTSSTKTCISTIPIVNNTAFAIGKSLSGGGYYQGQIGEAQTYRRVLSAQEIYAIYNKTKADYGL